MSLPKPVLPDESLPSSTDLAADAGIIFGFIHSPAVIVTSLICVIVSLRYELHMYGFLGDACTWCANCQAQCGPDYKGSNGGPMFGFMPSEADMPKHHDMWSDCVACLESPGYDENAPIVASLWNETLNETVIGNHPAARAAWPGVVAPPMLNSTCYCAIWVLILLPICCALMKVYEIATGTTFNDQDKPSWMVWDRVNPELYTFGVITDKVGHRMLIKGENFGGTWLTAQVTQVQGVGETTLVCKIIDHNNDGKVVEIDRVVDVSELAGFPYSMEVRADINRAYRPYYDTPLGTAICILVPSLFLWSCPFWKTSFFDCNTDLGGVFGKAEYGYCGKTGNWTLERDGNVYDDLVGVGLPAWASRLLLVCVPNTFMQCFAWAFLIRSTDSNGNAIAGTPRDWFAVIWPLDLTWGEIRKYGCRKRRDWVLDEVTQETLQDWANAHPDFEGFEQFKGKTGKEINAISTTSAASAALSLDLDGDGTIQLCIGVSQLCLHELL